ncbi:MAG: hypothetical protein V1861_04875 [Candidatus Micrarchaeota archaeon]
MKTLHKPEQPRFTAAAKSAAFLRGLMFGRPLLEVAREGLSHNEDESEQIRYAERIWKARDSETAFFALKSGVRSKKAECILASTIDSPDRAFALLITQSASFSAAQVILAKIVASADNCFQCYILLKLRTVQSPIAQEILAHAVHEGGLSDRAAELLIHGSLTSVVAQKKMSDIIPEDQEMIARILFSGNMELEAAKKLSKRMPRVCVPLE